MNQAVNQSSVQASGGEIDTFLVRAHSYAAFAMLLVSVTFGIFVSLQFIFPDFMTSWLPSWGRMRYAHTQGIMFGWLGNAFLAFMYHAVPVLSGHRVSSHRLGLWLFAVWNIAVMVSGWTLVLSGFSQPLEWAEFPPIVDAFVILGLLLAAAQFLPPFIHRGITDLYVSGWYLVGGLVFTLLSYPMGNFVPEVVPGAAGAAFSGLWIHDAVGLFVTPMALAILYYVIPATTGRPIFSHFLSMLGFWGLFFLYPLNGIHHYILSVIPMEMQTAAIIASFLLGVVVVIVVTNLMLSQRGAGLIPRDIGLRFASMAVLFYLVVSVQGSLQADMSLNQTLHFTDWVIGHSHLAMLGFATFAGIGGILHAWQRMPEARYNARAFEWAYGLLTVGIWLMVIDLTIAGIVQGQLWDAGTPWLESLRASHPYWVMRSLTAIPVAAGFIVLFAGLVTGPRGEGVKHIGTAQPEQATAQLQPEAAHASRGLKMSYITACAAGIVFFALSVSLLGLLPRQMLEDQSVAMAPGAPLPYTPAEERGREIYAREGCSYCHSQQIRYTQADLERFGAPTLAWEGRLEYPHMLGTRRIGPDLSRAGGTRSADWHYAHLFAPRTIVPQSIMPAYPQLFDGSATRPRQEARDLVAYLDSLGRARELAYPDGDIAARAVAGDDDWALMSLNAPQLNAHPGRTRPRGEARALSGNGDEALGTRLWLENCAGCHGDLAQGDGPAAAWLEPAPKNLSIRHYSRALLADVLWNGVHGSAMPAWRELDDTQRSALAAAVQGFARSNDEPANASQAAQGASVYARHCAECHGDNGAGNGFAAAQLPIAPTDFRGVRASLEERVKVLRNGVAGTSMAPWTDRLNDSEITAVAHYIGTFFQPDNTGARP
ncbi:MAG: cbb3-type cytochrome c oxidase subunit I [Pseudomonadales bacterium]|nr:cbb3-type cytochrome c oxidase subunit I [Pseudomonadales bacterium]MCP5330004.1 cbb3-type cytochrome c oxidase subunit I [Pseudomonadales bacterium]MCP5343088.1 cbb3-type cytochrome c oxidase subunit I [Pseudomonadales bacterium]